MQKNLRISLISGLFISVASFTLVGCLSGNTPTPTPQPTEVPSSAAGGTFLAEEVITLTAKDFQFSTSEIRVKENQVVKVVVTNEGGFHDFVVDELGINSGIIPTGQSKEVVIPTDRVGEFAFYCSVSNHRSRGMEGKIIVEAVEEAVE